MLLPLTGISIRDGVLKKPKLHPEIEISLIKAKKEHPKVFDGVSCRKSFILAAWLKWHHTWLPSFHPHYLCKF